MGINHLFQSCSVDRALFRVMLNLRASGWVRHSCHGHRLSNGEWFCNTEAEVIQSFAGRLTACQQLSRFVSWGRDRARRGVDVPCRRIRVGDAKKA